jgi:hypothetical protein
MEEFAKLDSEALEALKTPRPGIPLHVLQWIRENINPELSFTAELENSDDPEGLIIIRDQTGKEWFHLTQDKLKELLLPTTCLTCGGYRWFDDMGFRASGQPAFSFTPCPDCNPEGERQMWGNEFGDPGYKPGPDHRFRVLMADQTVGEYPPPKDK